MQEPKVSLICRKQDLSLVKDVYQEAGAEYTKKTQKKVELEVDTQIHLPAGPEEAKSEDIWYLIALEMIALTALKLWWNFIEYQRRKDYLL